MTKDPYSPRQIPGGPLTIAALMLLLALLGIMTRPQHALALLWPANAVLVGILLRYPSSSTPLGWIAAILGMLAADLLTGTAWTASFGRNLANIAGAGLGWALLYRHHRKACNLRRPRSILYLFLISAAASALAAALATGAALMQGLTQTKILYAGIWFSGDLLSYIAILSLILALPRPSRPEARRRSDNEQRPPGGQPIRNGLPLLGLIASTALCVLIPGPGFLVYPVPALLWCALIYRQWITAALTLACATFMVIMVSGNWPNLPPHDLTPDWLVSLRVGIILIVLVPLIVSSINAARNDLIDTLHHALDHDTLTDALSRRAFMRRASALLEHQSGVPTAVGLLMLDVDHFKQLNDEHGHATGDRVLVGISNVIRKALRKENLFGRIGGEEFAVLLPEASLDENRLVAKRLLEQVADARFQSESGQEVGVTISIGIAQRPYAGQATLKDLMLQADRAMYRAKKSGRNQIGYR